MSTLVRLPLRCPLVLHRCQSTLLASRGLRAWQRRRPQVAKVANITAALCEVAHEQLDAAKAANCRVDQALSIKHWPALVVVWLRQGGGALQQHLHELVLLLMTSLNKYRPGR